MKKLILAAIVGTFALTACKKDYTCECTTKSDGAVVATSSSTLNGKKDDVKAACEGTSSSIGTTSVSCVVK